MIDYSILAKSVEYYEARGYKQIESPWYIPRKISEITTPPGYPFFTIKEKDEVLVASGEQSLLSLYNLGHLPKGKFQTITPCFREESITQWNHKYFMKNELMITDFVNVGTLSSVIDDALSFFRQWVDVDVVDLKNGTFDIVYKNIELGSYGIRSCSFISWVYGTGVAEPRLSRAKGL